jgi:hypothetical protein
MARPSRRRSASRLLERVAVTRDTRQKIERDFRAALAAAHGAHSWAEIAEVAGLSPTGVRYLVNLHEKGEDSDEAAA